MHENRVTTMSYVDEETYRKVVNKNKTKARARVKAQRKQAKRSKKGNR